MDVSQIIKKSRIQTNTSLSQKTDQDMLDDLNTVRDGLRSELSTKNKKYSWTYYHPTTTVVGQNEYTIPKEDTVSNDPKLKRVLRIQINYGEGFIPCQIYDTSPVKSEENYDRYNKPIAIQRDGSVFIYPAPKQAIIGGIKIEGQYIPLPLELTTTSEDIKLPREYHDLLVLGLNRRNYADRLLYNEANMADQQYKIRLQEMINEGGEDIDGPYEISELDILTTGRYFLP